MTEPQPVETEGARALLFRRAPQWDGRKTIAVGGIAFESVEDGARLLTEISALARQEGFEAVIGPMDGDTWHSYRLVIESDGSPPFMLEPTSSLHDLPAFEMAGFAQISRYVSAIGRLEEAVSGEPASAPSVNVTPWDGRGAAGLVEELFAMSSQAFASNRFFTPITQQAFLGIYQPLLSAIDPEQVLFARGEDGQLVGFLFGMTDPPNRQRGASAILKTYASARRGVGRVLADTFHRRAQEAGLETVIHALMHEDNVSLDRSARHRARIFRRYALMGRTV